MMVTRPAEPSDNWKQLFKTTCLWRAGAGPCGCFAVRASRSPNLIASRQAHLLARAHLPILKLPRF